VQGKCPQVENWLLSLSEEMDPNVCQDQCLTPSTPPSEGEKCCWFWNEKAEKVCLESFQTCPELSGANLISEFAKTDGINCDEFCTKNN
jgi:hypothetical protein